METRLTSELARLGQGTMNDPGQIDQWSGLEVIAGVEDGQLGGLPPWIDRRDRRRLAAYVACKALVESSRRKLLREDDPTEHREFGDPAMLLDRIAAAIVGDQPQVSVVGADRSIPLAPQVPPPPPEPQTGEDAPELPVLDEELQTYIYEQARAAWLAQAQGITDEWVRQLSLQPCLDSRQHWLRDWAGSSKADLLGRVIEAEQDMIVPLGDGVFTLGWSAEKGRVEVHALEPDAYFPVLRPGDVEDFPVKVHLCWTFTEFESDGTALGNIVEVEYVTRITYELVPINPQAPGHVPGLDYTVRPRYLPEGGAATHACFYSHGTWRLEDFKSVYNAQEDSVVWKQIPDPRRAGDFVEANRVNTGLDFIPVVHVPHTLSRSTHFGRSPLARVAQLCDALAKGDTGRALAAAWAADPMTVLKGLQPGMYDPTKPLKLKPGEGFAADETGGVDVVNMSEQLDGLGRYVDTLIDRLATNMAIPKSAIGRVDAAEIPSGVALALLFITFDQLVMQAHMARESKYPLMLKMVQRIALHNGDEHMLEDPTIHEARIEWGAAKPTDISTLASVIKMLSDAGMLSTSAAITALQEVGFITGDHAVELAAQMAENGDLIESYAAALGGKYAARIAGVTDYEEPEADDLGQVDPLNDPADENDPSGGQSEA